MSPIEEELFADFSAVFLETLVPLEVQGRIPEVRKHWAVVLSSKEGKSAILDCFTRALRGRSSVAEGIRAGIARADRDVLVLKNTLYMRLARDHALISAFIGRTITNGNEQCPYWDHFAYEAPPRAEGSEPA